MTKHMTNHIFTNGQLFSFQEPLKELVKLDVPARVGIRIARLVRMLGREIEPILEMRNKLITKYGDKGEKGSMSINPDSPRWGEFVIEHNALMAEKQKVEFDRVILPSDAQVAVSVLVLLEPFLSVDDSTMNPQPNGAEKDVTVPTLVKN